MCEALGYKVTTLKRIRIMNVELGNLKPGEVRELTERELKELYGTVKERENERTGVSLLNKASRAYYQEDQEIMSNYE